MSADLRGISEPELVERAKGDPEAFAELYRRYRDKVHGFALWKLRNPADAEDLTSEVFVRVLGAIGRYRDTGVAFHCWLFRIAANVAADQRRGGRGRRHEDLDEHRDDLVAEGCLEELVARREEVRRVLEAAGRLPESQRQVLALRYGRDLTAAQVAERTGRTVLSARMLQHRALAALRAALPLEAAS